MYSRAKEFFDEVPSTLSMRFRVRFAGFSVDICTNDTTLASHIHEKSHPYFVTHTESDSPIATIAVVAHHSLQDMRARFERARPIKLFGSGNVHVEEGLCVDCEGVRLVKGRDSVVAVEPAANRVIIFVSGDGLASYIALHRVLLPLFTRAAERDGAIALHGSVAAREDGAVLVMGAKGAGKTTATLELLFHHGYSLVTSDIALVKVDETSSVSGIPESMRIGVGTMTQHTALEQYIDEHYRAMSPEQLKQLPDNEKKSFFLMQLRNILPAQPPLRATAPLKAIVLSTMLNHAPAAPECIRMNAVEVERLIDRENLSPNNPRRPHWIEFFPEPVEAVQVSKKRIIDFAVGTGLVYELRRGYGVKNAVAAVPGMC